MQMQQIEDSLKSDKFVRMFNEEHQRNPEINKAPPQVSKQFMADLEVKYRAEKRAMELRQSEEGREEAF